MDSNRLPHTIERRGGMCKHTRVAATTNTPGRERNRARRSDFERFPRQWGSAGSRARSSLRPRALRCLSGPGVEGAIERAWVLVAEQEGDLATVIPSLRR